MKADVLNSPNMIFTRGTSKEVLLNLLIDRLGITIQIQDNIQMFNYKQFVFGLVEAEDWLGILDNLNYSLYNNGRLQSFVEELGGRSETIQIAIGDIDYSHEILFYENNIKKRELVVSNNSCRKDELRVEIDYGKVMKGETIPLSHSSMLNILRHLGIDIEEHRFTLYEYRLSN